MKKFNLALLSVFLSGCTFAQSQFASGVIAFSTQWSTTSWAATQTLGAPNTSSCGDIATAWASASADGAREFLVLGFTTPQQVNRINIYETWNPGAVDTVYLRDASNGQWNMVFSATAASATPCPRTNTINITQTTYNVDAIRIAINSPVVPSWNEIDAVEIQNNCSVNISATGNPVSCFGDCTASATANATGQAPFTYSWTNFSQTTATITGLCAGTYTVFVTDASNCVATAAVTITEPTQINVTVTNITNASCSGGCDGTATGLGSGGCSPYTYTWTPQIPYQPTQTATGLCAGVHTVTVVDDCGCMNIATCVITEPSAITFATSQNNAVCFGDCNGTASVSNELGGCGGPYTYLWSTNPAQTTQSASGLCAGSYTVIVSDACGCTSSQVVTITEPPALQISVSSSPASCNICDGVLTASISGGCGNYSYSWSPVGGTNSSATGLCPGTYTVFISDACGCTTSVADTVSQANPVTGTVSTNLSSCQTCCDGSATVNPAGGNPPYSYFWIPGNETTQNVTGLCATFGYTVFVTDANGCTYVDSACTAPPNGIYEKSNPGFIVTPNPSSDWFQLVFTDRNLEVEKLEVFDLRGRLLLMTSELRINLSGHPGGIYWLKVHTRTGILARKIVLKPH